MLVPLLTAAGTSTTWLDPIIVGIIIASVALGAFRGLIRTVGGLAALALGVLFAGRVALLIDPTLDQAHVQHPPITGAVAFFMAFLAIAIGVQFVAGLLRRVVRLMFLGWLDTIGGAALGLVRGILLSMVLLAGFAMFGSKQFNSTLRQAQVAVFLWQNMDTVAAMLPPGMKESTIRLVHDQDPFSKLTHPPTGSAP